MAREKCGFLAVPHTVPVQLMRYPYTAHVRPWEWNAVNVATALWMVSCTELQKCLLCFPTWNIATCILCVDFVMAIHVLLLKNTEGVFSDRRIPSRGVFTGIHQTMRKTGCLPSVAVQSEREAVRTINTRENILGMVQRSPRLSTRRMACRIGVSRTQVWRTLHEVDLYPYHDQRVQHLEPGDHAQRMDLCHWITAHP